MNNLPQHYVNEQTGISYTLTADDNYYLPDLALPEEPVYEIGQYGIMRKQYLKNHQKGLFTALLTTGKLNEHLYGIDQIANDRMEFISKQLAISEGVTERLKASDQMLWVQKMTNIRNRVQELIRTELIYS
jgi:hypothetical protein